MDNETAGRRLSSRIVFKPMTARCPFHEEKTPSMIVDFDKGEYRCLSCEATGKVSAKFYVVQENNS